jgi:hypothetical protein
VRQARRSAAPSTGPAVASGVDEPARTLPTERTRDVVVEAEGAALGWCIGYPPSGQGWPGISAASSAAAFLLVAPAQAPLSESSPPQTYPQAALDCTMSWHVAVYGADSSPQLATRVEGSQSWAPASRAPFLLGRGGSPGCPTTSA